VALLHGDVLVSAIVKRCACGLDYTAEEWSRLPLVGYYDDDALDAEHPQATTLELRNCMCHSTLTVEKPRRKAYVAPRLVRLAANDPRVIEALRRGRP